MDLVIVESPAKAKTINKYLGSNYKVIASYGHVRDLPVKDGSVEPDSDFLMHWEVQADKSKRMREIAAEVKLADRLILATDPDREGEAISWHLLEELKKKKAIPSGGVQRVTFTEITKNAVTEAMARPRDLDDDLVDAYLARRALDYLVGFTLSPVLWRKLPGAKSAGRVQSVALRLICVRESEIEQFVSQEYWSIDAMMDSGGSAPFKARLTHLKGKKLGQFDLPDEQQAMAAKVAVEAAHFTIQSVEKKPVGRNPQPPFTTSSLQQEAARKLGFSATETMRIAQQLYEGISIGGETTGLITYMRTDGVQMSNEAIGTIRDLIGKDHGAAYLPDKPRFYASKAKNAQEAHEAIRPTAISRRPTEVARALSSEQRKLYELIWKRTVASQMASARLERTTVDLACEDKRTMLRATGQIVAFPGFLAVYEEDSDDGRDDEESRLLPPLYEGEKARTRNVAADQHFTQPPPRFSEASLVKKLEELGIGRPSTYASTLQTLRDRGYVEMDRKRFVPNDKGRLLSAFLEKFFERYVEYDFTALLEKQLDEVSAGEANWRDVLRAFWGDFLPKTEEIMQLKPSEVTAQLDLYLEPLLFPKKADGSDARVCPSCADGRLSLKGGRYGAFVGCSNYPECRYTRPFGAEEKALEAAADGPTILGQDPESGRDVSVRTGRFGRYVQLGEEAKPPRASIPKDVDPDSLDLELALKLLALPRIVGNHPETGKPITAAIGRYGPYVLHDGTYANLKSTEDVLTIGMNQAVAVIADKLANPGRRGRSAPEPLKVLGAHPESGAEVKVMSGRYGPYVTDGSTNATIPKAIDPAAVTMDEAVSLITERIAKGGGKKKPARKATPKKAPAAKAPAKKPAAKKVAAKKPAGKKAGAKKSGGAASSA